MNLSCLRSKNFDEKTKKEDFFEKNEKKNVILAETRKRRMTET